MASTNYGVVCVFEIENYTKWPMDNPISYANTGYIKNPPVPVMSGKREAMVTRKTGHTATGTFGTASWLVNGQRRAIVMWSAPYSFDFHSNWLAVGIIGANSHVRSLADTMYEEPSEESTYTLGEFYDSTRIISYCDDVICVHGTMGTAHKTFIKIEVYPVSYDNLAGVSKNYINRENYHVTAY